MCSLPSAVVARPPDSLVVAIFLAIRGIFSQIQMTVQLMCHAAFNTSAVGNSGPLMMVPGYDVHVCVLILRRGSMLGFVVSGYFLIIKLIYLHLLSAYQPYLGFHW